MQNKNYIIIGVVILLLGLGAFFYLSSRNAEPVVPVENSLDEEVVTLSPEEIGLELVASANNRQVKFVINKPDGISALEYELSYEADAAGGEEGRISRGVAGEEELDGTEEVYESKFLDLGSCSSGTCRYDTGVESVNLLLKVTKSDDTVYQVEDSLTLE
jgi:hypothetical protein